MASRLPIGFTTVALGAALLVSPGYAQGRRGGGARGFGRGQGQGRSTYRITVGGGRGEQGRGRMRGRGVGGYFLPPYYITDNGYPEPEPPSPPTPPPAPVVVVKQPKAPAPPAKPVEPLLLEYRDGQWVRVPSGNHLPSEPLVVQPEAGHGTGAKSAATEATQTAQPTKPVPSAMIVYRDGHTETLKRYVIRDGAIYASQNYWETGSWTKKIPLSALNIPATMKLNEERGAKFELPDAPNVVVVGL